MALLEWKPGYSVGVPGVDLEHRELILLINEVYERLDEGENIDEIEDCLGEIHSTIAAHFALEENLMRTAGYDDYEAHKENHEDLLDQVRDFMDCYTQDQATGRNLLQQRLDQWFSVHFSTHDARLHKKLHI